MPVGIADVPLDCGLTRGRLSGCGTVGTRRGRRLPTNAPGPDRA